MVLDSISYRVYNISKRDMWHLYQFHVFSYRNECLWSFWLVKRSFLESLFLRTGKTVGKTAKETFMVKRKICLGMVLLGFGIFLIGCATSQQVSSGITHDNSVLMAKEFDILSREIVRVEIPQIEPARRGASAARSVNDRILETLREGYPNTDAVLIASQEAVGITTSSAMGGGTQQFIYVIYAFPIKYR